MIDSQDNGRILANQQGWFGWVLCVVASLMTSCASTPLPVVEVAPRDLAAAAPTFQAPQLLHAPAESPVPPPVADDPADTLSLRQAVALALLYNPNLAAYAWDVRAAEARQVQAGLPPNPGAGYGVENLGMGDRDDFFRHQTLRVSQVIELAGKRNRRRQLAVANQRLAAWDYEDRRLDVVAQVGRRYVAVVAAQERVVQAERSVQVTRRVFDIVDERVRAGIVPSADRDKATVRVSLERIALDRAQRQLHASRQMLVSMWGGQQPTFDRVGGDLNQHFVVPDQNVLMKRARNHPRLARWDDEVAQRRQAVELARAVGVPDLTVGAGLRHFPDADDVAGIIELSIPLPLMDRNQGRVLEARYRLGRALSQQRAAEADMRVQLADAHADLSSAQFALRTLRTESLPAAKASLAAAQDAFQKGAIDFIEVLDAERTLVDVERALIDARETFHSTVAMLEGLTAARIDQTAADRNESGTGE